MKIPLLMILISQMGFILLFENNSLELNTITSLIIIDLFMFIVALMYFNNIKYIKLGILLIFKIILIINLLNYYESPKFKLGINFPQREIILKIKVNSFSNTKYYNSYEKAFYCKITSAPKVKKDLVGQNIICFLDNSKEIILSKVNITIKGVLLQNRPDEKTKYKLVRCTIIKTSSSDVAKLTLINKLSYYLKSSFRKYETINPEIRGFLHAVFLGDKTLLTKEQLNIFRKSGTLHLFAVSGLHIGFLYLIFKYLFTFICHKRHVVEISVSIILLVYLEIIAYPPSAVRACIMIFFWQLSSILFKKKNPYSSLCWSCLLVLIVNPSSILSIGFQLSYTVVLTILIFSYHINQKSNRSFLSFSSFTINSLIVSYSAFCGSLLLIYDHFDIIVPVSILINIIAIPITFIFIISIFSMLIFQNIIDVEIFGEVFQILYNLLKSIIMLLSHENISFFFIRNKVDLNNVVHFLYPLFFLLYFSIIKNFYLKIIGHLLIPIILIVLFSYVFV